MGADRAKSGARTRIWIRLFAALAADGSSPTFLVGRGGAHASSITMPTVSGIDVPDELPACPSPRGQPRRTYRAVDNVIAR